MRHARITRVTVEKNNVSVNLTNTKGQTTIKSPCGTARLRVTKKKKPLRSAAKRIAGKSIPLAKSNPYRAKLAMRGIPSGRKSLSKDLRVSASRTKLNVVSFQSRIPLIHNGCRPPKKRRIQPDTVLGTYPTKTLYPVTNHIDTLQNHSKAVPPESFSITAIITLPWRSLGQGQASFVCDSVAANVGAGLASSGRETYFAPSVTRTARLSIQTSLICIMLVCEQSSPSPLASQALLSSTLIVDDLTPFVKSIIPFSALPSISVGVTYQTTQKINSFEYLISIPIGTSSALLIVPSHDSISTHSAIEPQSPSSHVSAACPGDQFSTEAGLKYPTSGAPSPGLSPFGESILYGFAGVTGFEDLSKSLASGEMASGQ